MLTNELLELHKQEYIKLKEEQAKRIGFRDNLLYVNLLLISGIISFVFNSDRMAADWQLYGLLLGGWVAIILGWTYVVNDEKISSIGRYIRVNLIESLKAGPEDMLFGWETVHRSDGRRRRRKIQQLVIDELSFAGVGLFEIGLFWHLAPQLGFWALAVSISEAVLLLVLGIETFLYADIKRNK